MMGAVSAFVDRWSARTVLGLALLLCGALGLLTPYLLVALGGLLLVFKAIDGSLWPAYRAPATQALAAVFLVLLAAFASTAQQPQDALFAFNFVALLLFAPLYSALDRRRTDSGALTLARLALIGALVCLAVGVVNMTVWQTRRESGLIGVIVLSNTAVLLGFLALIGVAAAQGGRRWLYLLGPVLGVATALVTASRGPLIAVAPLALLGMVFLTRALRLRWPVVAGIGAAVIAALGATAWLLGGRIARMPQILAQVLAGEHVADRNTVSRLDLYQAAWHAFRQEPLLGHGWANLMEAASPFLADPSLARLPQLHNDLADFAVAAGLVGIACYVALLAIPVTAALLTPRDSQYGLRLYGASVLSLAYFCDGLTDLMFGFEFHTGLYAALLAIILGYCRDRETTT